MRNCLRPDARSTKPPVNGDERIRGQEGKKALHANQKPLKLMERQILASTDIGDVAWAPFGGLCSASVAALNLPMAKARGF
jgi:site-specific DNA-methyltransferase (adenine-specific)